MIYVRPPHLRVKPKELPRSKTYSYSDVERFVLKAIKILGESGILLENKIEINGFPDPADRGVRFDVCQEGQREHAILFIEGREK